MKQLLDNKLELKYINGKYSDEYKIALRKCSFNDVSALKNYIEQQKNFILENKDMF